MIHPTAFAPTDLNVAFCFRGLKFREEEKNKDINFVDVSYDKLVRDPLAMVKDIYKQLNMDLSHEVEERMAEAAFKRSSEWKAHCSRAWNEKTRPQLEDFGVTTDDVHHCFSDYSMKFWNQLGGSNYAIFH